MAKKIELNATAETTTETEVKPVPILLKLKEDLPDNKNPHNEHGKLLRDGFALIRKQTDENMETAKFLIAEVKQDDAGLFVITGKEAWAMRHQFDIV